MWVVHELFGFSPRGDGDGGYVEGFIALLVGVDAWVANVVRSLIKQETLRGQRQKLYTHIQGRMLELGIAQPTIGNVWVVLQYLAGGEVASGTGGGVTHVVEVPSTCRGICV